MSNPDQPPAGKHDAYTRDRMQKIARLVDEELPVGWGFFVMAFPMGAAEGRMNYVSNGSRDDIVKLMQEFIDKGGFREGHHADELSDADRVGIFVTLHGGTANAIPIFQKITGWQESRVKSAFDKYTVNQQQKMKGQD